MAKEIKKYTKKASAYIMKFLLKEHPDISKLTSYDQAFVTLMTDWDLEVSIKTSNHHTICDVYRGDEIIRTFEWDNIDTDEPLDLNWDILYKDVLETIIKKRLYKQSKSIKRKTKTTKNITIKPKKTQNEPEVSVVITPIELTKDELKKKKSSLYQKIREWKQKGKDVSKLVEEYNNISKKLK